MPSVGSAVIVIPPLRSHATVTSMAVSYAVMTVASVHTGGGASTFTVALAVLETPPSLVVV